ncbi:hypothetical protein D3C86_2220310 [compost metagenome]
MWSNLTSGIKVKPPDLMFAVSVTAVVEVAAVVPKALALKYSPLNPKVTASNTAY